MATPSHNQYRSTSLVHCAAIHNTHSTKGSATLANGDGCIVRGNQRKRKSEQTGRQRELQPMPRLKPKANLHTTTNTSCGSQRELTPYSFQPYLAIHIRSSTSGRLMPPARSRRPIAVLVPSIGSYAPTSHNQYRSTTLVHGDAISNTQSTKGSATLANGHGCIVRRNQRNRKSEQTWSARRTATDVKAKTKGQLPQHH